MAGELIWAFRVMRLPLRDAGGAHIGRVQDIVAVPGRPGDPPRVTGFVAESQRRRIFVNANRLADLGGHGLRLRSWDVDLNPFKSRPGEVLVGRDVIDHKVGEETVSDVALHPVADKSGPAWEIAKVRLARRNLLRRKPSYRLVDVDEVGGLFPPISAVAAEAARLRDLHPSEVAGVVRGLPARPAPPARRGDGRRAPRRPARGAARTGADPSHRGPRPRPPHRRARRDGVRRPRRPARRDVRRGARRILEAMDADDADVVRRLLSYEEATAGGMMTPELIVLGPTATVADALAQIREPDWVVSIAAQVFVCHPPFKAPTGKFLGTAHMQRLLREQPSTELRHCVSTDPVVAPDTSDVDVAELLASYDMLAVAVCDKAGSLLGAVTVDDVLDRQLGVGWRQRHRGVTNRTRTA